MKPDIIFWAHVYDAKNDYIIKGMEVCRMRDTPIVPFINKFDREPWIGKALPKIYRSKEWDS